MKLIFLFFFIPFFLNAGFSQTEIPHQFVSTNYSNGNLNTEKWIVDNNEDSYNKYYYENGNLKKQGWLKNNLKEDYWKFYYENGNLKSEGKFYKNV